MTIRAFKKMTIFEEIRAKSPHLSILVKNVKSRTIVSSRLQSGPTQEDNDENGIGDVCEGCCVGITGNIDNDPLDIIDISDLVYVIDFAFREGPYPICLEEADVTGDADGIDIEELVYLVDYMFRGGVEPVNCPE